MLALLLIFPPLPFNLPTPQSGVVLPPALIKVAQTTITSPQFPDYRQNYQNTVVTPDRNACDAQGGTLQPDLSCYVPPPPPVPVAPVYEAPAPTYATPVIPQTDTLFGSLGYALSYGNCVDEPGVNNPFDGSNPISWAVLTETPAIGESVLFYFNHVAVVTGIWSNGDIEVRQRNWQGVPITRFPRRLIRGFR